MNTTISYLASKCEKISAITLEITSSTVNKQAINTKYHLP